MKVKLQGSKHKVRVVTGPKAANVPARNLHLLGLGSSVHQPRKRRRR